MRGPNPVLMHYYGNEALYQEKLAGVVGGVLGAVAGQAAVNQFIMRVAGGGHGLKALPPLLIGAALGGVLGSALGDRLSPTEKKAGVPEDMVRLASVAAQAGADMAKRAGIVGGALKGLVKSPTARGVAAGGVLLGGGLLAAKAMKAVPNAMEHESGPRSFGPGRFGYSPPMGVNQYGQPQSGTPLM